jgi:hypothetical protein
MIQVRALRGPIPVDLFLRAARELVAVAMEVGQNLAFSTQGVRASAGLPGSGMGTPDPRQDGISSDYHSDEACAGWRIVRTQSTGSQEGGSIDGWEDLGNVPGQSVALVIAPPVSQRTAAQAVREGVRSIHARDPQRPEGFTDAALRALRRAASLSGRQVQITLSSGQGEGAAVPLDTTVVAHIDSWLAGQRNAIGTVEGKLDVISVHNRLRFTIYGVHGERVECHFQEALLPLVKSALGERVCIRGRVHYRKDGVPASVEAQWLRLQGSTRELAQPWNSLGLR